MVIWNGKKQKTKSNCKEKNMGDIKLENVTFSKSFQKISNQRKYSNRYCPAIETIANADTILVMVNESIVESENHNAIVKQKGNHRDLFNKQGLI